MARPFLLVVNLSITSPLESITSKTALASFVNFSPVPPLVLVNNNFPVITWSLASILTLVFSLVISNSYTSSLKL